MKTKSQNFLSVADFKIGTSRLRDHLFLKLATTKRSDEMGTNCVDGSALESN